MAASAEQLPVQSNTFDVVVSALALNFVPSPERAVHVMSRVVRPRGVVAAYVWDYASGMQMMRHFWDAAAALDADARMLDEAQRFPLCHPERLALLFRDTGLAAVDTRALAVATRFADFNDYWTPFLGGQGPAPSYVKQLSDTHRQRLRDRIHRMLPVAEDGSIALTARAWAVRGVKEDT
jgi:SAM-dependent methyltransferase